MTLHADAVRTLTRWTAPDADQEQLRQELLAHLDRHPDGVWRSGRPDHLTGSGIVVSSDARQVLLHLHAKVGRWLQFGGHLEPGDRGLAAAAVRESVEESGITQLVLLSEDPLLLDRHPAPCAPGEARDHLDVQFGLLAPPGARPTASAESQAVRWFAADSLPQDADASVKALVRAAVAVARTRAVTEPAQPSAVGSARPAAQPSR